MALTPTDMQRIAARTLAAIARARSGCSVLEQDFLALSLPHGGFDGLFGKAALFHDWPTWKGCLRAAGFSEITHFSRPTNAPLGRQPWLASAWRKAVNES